MPPAGELNAAATPAAHPIPTQLRWAEGTRTSGGVTTPPSLKRVTRAATMAPAANGLKVAALTFDPHYIAGGCGIQFARRRDDGIYLFDAGLQYSATTRSSRS